MGVSVVVGGWGGGWGVKLGVCACSTTYVKLLARLGQVDDVTAAFVSVMLWVEVEQQAQVWPVMPVCCSGQRCGNPTACCQAQ